MKDIEFPIFKTKVSGDRPFNLSDPKEREEYFYSKQSQRLKR